MAENDQGDLASEPGGAGRVQRLRKARLVVIAGPDRGAEYALDRPRCTGGRGRDNDLVLSDDAVSDVHFEIVVGQDGYRLRDVGSQRGTFLGDVRIRDVYVQPGMTFRVAGTEVQLQARDGFVEHEPEREGLFPEILGASTAMGAVLAHVEKVAMSELTCLITGETGTGKEMIARAIHRASSRRDRPFVVLDCGAIPRELIESTLFGHEKGSFTGAVEQHRGCFEQADGGTIFLDEVGELDLAFQPKLLRVLEQRELKRVGGSRTITVDVRVLAATNRDLGAEVRAGTFREDLYFRLSVVHVELPALRQRREDIAVLARHFLHEIATRRDLPLSFDAAAMQALLEHPWPGNVRELRNVVERAAMLCNGSLLRPADLILTRDAASTSPASFPVSAAPRSEGAATALDRPARFSPELLHAGLDFKEAKQRVVDAFEAEYLAALLERNHGNISRSAVEAGLTRYHLRELLKRHHLGSR